MTLPEALAMIERLTTIRPASEHDGKTPATWYIYREQDGEIRRMPVGDYALSLDSQYLYWLPRIALAEPKCPLIVPNLQQLRTHPQGLSPSKQRKADMARGR
jgi:hypothetical protein